MRTPRLLAAGLAAVTLVAGTTVPAASSSQTLPRRIDLPRGWQPEGITTDGTRLYVGSLKNGGLWVVNPATGRKRVLSPGAKGRLGVGVDYDRRRDLLWVAGGPTGVVRAHDADTGRIRARYDFGDGRFINDLAVTRYAVYATDSMSSQLAVVPLPRDVDRLAPKAKARTLDLTGDFQPVPDEFNLNGIENHAGWLLAVQSVNGRLFRINPRTGATLRVDVAGARLTNGDGLELRGETLYVVRNFNNLVVALQLDERLTSAERVAGRRHRSLDVPTTAAVAHRALWAVNARFGTDPTPRTAYWITRLRLAHR
jgi:sugar lactone lactonase YvrE